MSNGKIKAQVRVWAGMLLALLAALSPVQAQVIKVQIFGPADLYSIRHNTAIPMCPEGVENL